MPGICGCINNNSVDKMTKTLIVNQYIEVKNSYKDDLVEISQASLKKLCYNKFENDKLVIFIEGTIYNLEDINNLCNFNAQNFYELLYFAYEKNLLKKVLNKINGYFNACIYDKINKKINIFSDRFGLKLLYYYFKDGDFAFSGEIKALLPLDIDKTIDKKSIQSFIESQIGYLVDDNTYFQNIKIIKPSSIIEYDIKEKTMKQEYYWKYSEIVPQNISYEDAVDIIHELFMQSVKRRLSNISDKEIGLSLSGGLDSRLCLAAITEINKRPNYIWTMGRKNCRDVKFAKMVCDKLNLNQNVYEMPADDWINKRYKNIWLSDGLATFIDIHGCEYSEKTALHYTYLVDGYCGDAIFGKSFKERPEHLNKRINKEIAEIYYGKDTDNSDLENDYYDINHIEAHLYANRVRKYTTMGMVWVTSCVEPVFPFMDNDIIEFIFSIPDDYRTNNKLYADMLLKYYPDLFKDIPWASDAMTISGKLYKNEKFIDKLNFISNKWKKSIKKRLNFYKLYKSSFCDYIKMFKSKKFKKFANEIFNNALYLKYTDTKEDLYKKHTKKFNLAKLNNLITIEIYLKQLKEQGYLYE